jgi:hypothetical protein
MSSAARRTCPFTAFLVLQKRHEPAQFTVFNHEHHGTRTGNRRKPESGLPRHQPEAEPALAGLYEDIARSRRHLFSATTVFISPEQYR